MFFNYFQKFWLSVFNKFLIDYFTKLNCAYVVISISFSPRISGTSLFLGICLVLEVSLLL